MVSVIFDAVKDRQLRNILAWDDGSRPLTPPKPREARLQWLVRYLLGPACGRGPIGDAQVRENKILQLYLRDLLSISFYLNAYIYTVYNISAIIYAIYLNIYIYIECISYNKIFALKRARLNMSNAIF